MMKIVTEFSGPSKNLLTLYCNLSMHINIIFAFAITV